MPSDEKCPGIALITGAAKRIGRSIALDLASQGWDIAIHYNSSDEEAWKTVQEIKDLGRKAITLKADLGNERDVAGLVPACVDQLAAPTCLINNASRFAYDEITTLTNEGWQAHLNINLRAPVLLAQAFAQALPQDQSGNIINIVDQRVWKLTPLFFSYTISKAGLWTATQTLAQALAPRIRVNAIGPGPVLKSIHQTEEQFDRQQRATLLEHGTSPKEIARAICFILDAPALTGQMIALDGGQHLAWQTPDVTGVDS